MEPPNKRLRMSDNTSIDLSIPTNQNMLAGVNLESLPEQISVEQIRKILDAADEVDIDVITSNNVDRAILQLERKVKRNEEQRLKHPDSPEKFLKSEVDLDEEIQRIKQVAASTELISHFINLNGVQILIPLLQHNNTDIAGSVINVLAELTSPESVLDLNDPLGFVKLLIELGLLSLLSELLYQIKEDQSDEDYEIISNCLQIVENLLEIDPPVVSEVLTSKATKFIPWLIRRIRLVVNPSNPICYNRVYSTEILAIILQNSQKCRQSLGLRSGLDGIGKLLRSLTGYRKKDPLGGDEEEYVGNLCDCLVALLQEVSNRSIFGQLQGVELMIRFMKDRMKTYPYALKLLTYALEDIKDNCHLFIDKLGLKCLFGIFMRKGVHVKPSLERELDEHCVSIILNLCRNTRGTATARLMNKFLEKKCEKLERLLELHQKYYQQIQLGEIQRKKIKDLKEITDELELNEEDQNYLDRCEDGLFIVQSVDNIVLRLANMGNVLLNQRIYWLLNIKGIQVQEIHQIITEYLQRLNSSAKDEQSTIIQYLQHFVDGIEHPEHQ